MWTKFAQNPVIFPVSAQSFDACFVANCIKTLPCDEQRQSDERADTYAEQDLPNIAVKGL